MKRCRSLFNNELLVLDGKLRQSLFRNSHCVVVVCHAWQFDCLALPNDLHQARADQIDACHIEDMLAIEGLDALLVSIQLSSDTCTLERESGPMRLNVLSTHLGLLPK